MGSVVRRANPTQRFTGFEFDGDKYVDVEARALSRDATFGELGKGTVGDVDQAGMFSVVPGHSLHDGMCGCGCCVVLGDTE